MTWVLIQGVGKVLLSVGLIGLLLALFTRNDRGYLDTLEERLADALADLEDRDADIAALKADLARCCAAASMREAA